MTFDYQCRSGCTSSGTSWSIQVWYLAYIPVQVYTDDQDYLHTSSSLTTKPGTRVLNKLHAGLMSPSDFVRATSTAAAQTFNIYPRKGVIRPGSDADVIIFDPNIEHTILASTHHSRIDQNIYEGRSQRGKVWTFSSLSAVMQD